MSKNIGAAVVMTCALAVVSASNMRSGLDTLPGLVGAGGAAMSAALFVLIARHAVRGRHE